MPKLDTQAWQSHPGTPNRITGQDDGPYAEVKLADAAGLTLIGARLERLPPGSRSSHRHWHETEDELLYVISGELVLVEDSETVLRAGDAAGWKAGSPVAHCLENRSDQDAVALVMSNQASKGVVHYPDHDLVMHHDGDARRFTHTDGTPYTPKA